FFIGTACDKLEEKKAPPQAPPPPPEVEVYKTLSEEIPIYKTFVGQVYGAKDISIRARVQGFLKGIHFKEGFPVKKGELLYIIESQPFEAEVASKKGLLAEANTNMVKTKRELERYRPLAEQKAISQSDLDGAVAAYEAAQASVSAAQANLRAAKIQMGYTRIYAPIDGIIGKTQAKVGDFVGQDPNPVILNTVSNTTSVLVEFFLTERMYLSIARHMVENKTERAEMTREPDIRLILADGYEYPHKGKPNFLDRQMDPATGAILFQVSFPNPDNLLRPGQFAKVKTRVAVVKDGVLVPQRSVGDLQGRKRIFVVDDQNTVHERKVTLGPSIDNFYLIKKGLKAGERVIYEGLQKVGDGRKVKATEVQVERITQDEN
ncbi:MAG: efflux RND transporter periplasmic adaptor subunit, partial [Desulfobacterales bacterium]|nr:efflux RND transporter periplasmic adaptor subunit [Desulfobacterales bacterium]